eukprot:Sspe_Gene.66615::Locus_39350_Transcript_1_1_Confidence_1.000_Length_2253::g.66615::m.66615/K13751/SLC24A3, NCKX3; solute carrier family 24 (sodium/potassium/calcium exchanger), member 3
MRRRFSLARAAHRLYLPLTILLLSRVVVALNNGNEAPLDEAPVQPPSEPGCDSSEFLNTLCLSSVDGNAGGMILELFIFAWAFLALAIVCDDYLVASLETLCVRWSIREDIAGCTFMAFGSAAPEIIVNAVATIKSSSSSDSTDLGIAAIIGSGMIAFMLIPGFCGVFGGADEPLVLKRRPLLRDVGTYAVGIVELCVFFHDGKILISEAAIMVSTYVLYIIIVIVSPKIRQRLIGRKTQSSFARQTTDADDDGDEETRAVSRRKTYKMVKFLRPPTGSPDGLQKDGAGVEEEVMFPESAEDLEKGEGTFLLNNERQMVYNSARLIMSSLHPRIHLSNQDGLEETIPLPVIGYEKLMAQLWKYMTCRGIQSQQEWDIGSEVEGWWYTHFAPAVVTARADDGTYTVAWDDGTETFAKNLQYSDLRPRGIMDNSRFKPVRVVDVEKGNVQDDEDGEADECRALLASPPPAHRISRDGMSESGSVSDAHSRFTGASSLSAWRRQWWREELREGKSCPAVLVPFKVAGEVLAGFWQFIFKYTIPNAEVAPEGEVSPTEHLYPVTFILSFMWVAVFSFVISTIASRWADKSGLGSSFFGLLLVSVGAEIPDCIQSVTVAKRGWGSMAVSNAIGSQNVNVLIGLGIPWLLFNLAKGENVRVHDHKSLQMAAFFQAGGITLNFCCLLGAALVMKKSKASLGKTKGYVMIAAYFSVITAYAISTR